ncbi:hypothetical protein LEP1GSC199_1162 [Leptospira vanthielii serovar Holland str. Waz Holland = ATCC 700522]|uniref:Uncharacterized protein n=1 Tax=Leptospira vanthielii serovar Holland str. Waz Holland = ATCC 700522 TaxID=1218591 RepID=N1W3N5_9LEPT|nr:hypothetical protein LEP1GSC199_1162 [Leptospira vanthielii serovar Holland str. Waz Holland = ATCC 700522]
MDSANRGGPRRINRANKRKRSMNKFHKERKKESSLNPKDKCLQWERIEKP